MRQKEYVKVGDVDVVAQQVARDHMYGRVDDVRPISTVLELLLADDTTVFGCNYDSPSAKDCVFTAATVRSVTAHQRVHSRKLREKRIHENRSAGALKAAETRKAKRRSTEQVPLSTTSPDVTGGPGGQPMPKVNRRATQVSSGLDKLALQLQGLSAEMRDIAAALDRISRNLPQSNISEKELAQLRADAEKFQTFKGMLS